MELRLRSDETHEERIAQARLLRQAQKRARRVKKWQRAVVGRSEIGLAFYQYFDDWQVLWDGTPKPADDFQITYEVNLDKGTYRNLQAVWSYAAVHGDVVGTIALKGGAGTLHPAGGPVTPNGGDIDIAIPIHLEGVNRDGGRGR